MATSAVATFSSKCLVPIQENAYDPCRQGGRRSLQLPAAVSNVQHGCTLPVRKTTWSRRTLPKYINQVVAASSQNYVSTTDLEEEIHMEESGVGEEQSPNYKLLLLEKAEEVRDDLNGTCIFLIGMIGSEKSSIGRIIAEELGYFFFDSDDLVQQAAGGVTEISEEEEGYREAETEVLKQLSVMGRLVVATGAGTVVKSENWGFLRHGIIVWIDVPLDTLARDTKAQQLLAIKCTGDEALVKLSKLYEERIDAYRNADATISILAMSAQLGIEDPAAVTPTMTASEILNEIGKMIKKKKDMSRAGC